jgi:hypothetical protein
LAQKSLDPQQISKIYELFESGSMITEIVAKVGTNRETVRQYLLKKYTPDQKRAIVRKNIRWLRGKDSPNWKGGRALTKEGYIYLRPSRTEKILEHRQLMENHLGRKLAKSEVIHHINGNNADNRLANLQLTTYSEDIRRHQLERYKK